MCGKSSTSTLGEIRKVDKSKLVRKLRNVTIKKHISKDWTYWCFSEVSVLMRRFPAFDKSSASFTEDDAMIDDKAAQASLMSSQVPIYKKGRILGKSKYW